MIEQTQASQWYLIQTKPNQDGRAEEHLQRQHYHCYRPLQKIERCRRGRTRAVEESLFPGYLFIRLDNSNDNWYPIRSTRGVSKIVSFGNRPLPVRESLIREIQARLSVAEATTPLFQHGDRVRINRGSFADLEAIFLTADGNQRAIILMNLLQRDQPMTVPLRHLSKLN